MHDFIVSASLTALLLLALSPAAAQGPGPSEAQVLDVLLVGREVVPGRLVEIGDAGAMRIAADGGEFELRLLNVALPRQDSALGEEALDLLRERLSAQPIEVHILARPEDPDLAVGYPKVEGVDIRLELLEQGLARYCPGGASEAELEALDQAARDQGKGIWGGSAPACGGASVR